MIKSLEILDVGSCTFPDFVFRKKGRFRKIRFPAKVALINDSTLGWMLFDTGYAQHFFDTCQHWPDHLYALITPVNLPPEQSLLAQLKQRNICPTEIKHLFISHFHADHISGLRDFPNATFYYQKIAYDQLVALPKWKQVQQGFLNNLLPDHFTSRSQLLPASNLSALDSPILNSQSYHWINLPGHAPGHSGLLIHHQNHEILLCADAFWMERELTKSIKLTATTRRILHSQIAYQQTQESIRQWIENPPQVKMRRALCCHDPSATAQEIDLT